jgi:hypothetical protein
MLARSFDLTSQTKAFDPNPNPTQLDEAMNEKPKDTNAHLVQRLLGPDGPEITCEECFEYLDRYVELELSGADADAAVPGMDAHLIGCPACGEDYRSLRAMVQADRGE